MKVYTLSINFIKHLDIDGILSILYPLINPFNDNKIALDNNLELISTYRKEVNNLQNFNDWISYLSDSPILFVGIDYDFKYPIDDVQIAEMTSRINGARTMIADSLQTIQIELDNNNNAQCGKQLVHIENKDTAKKAINSCNVQYNSNCMIASDHSTIQKSKITE